jgi:ATP/maltotriose-dependent transcriptional regulator MalT
MDDFAGAAEPIRRALDLLGLTQKRERTIATAFCGWITMHEGDFDCAIATLDEARQVFCEIGEPWHHAASLNLMGFAACYAGRLAQARTLFVASRELFIDIGDPAIAAHCPLGMGRAAWMEGNLDDAEQQYHNALAECREHHDTRGTAYAIEGLARIASDRGEHIAAMRLTGASQRIRDQIALRRDPMDLPAFEAVVQAATGALSESDRKSAWDVGYMLGEKAADHQ